jgi:hypothetical protein
MKRHKGFFVIGLCGFLGAVIAPGWALADAGDVLFPNTKASILWRFDADSAEAVSVGGTSAKAVSLYPDEPLRFAPGLFGRALDISLGYGSLTVAHDGRLVLTNNFSVEFVICPRTLSHFRTIIMKGDRACRPNRINYTLDIRDGHLEFKTMDRQGEWVVFAAEKAVNSNEWLWARFSFKNGKVRCWLNGQPEKLGRSELPGPDQFLIANNAPLLIGCGLSASGGGNDLFAPFDGLIDHISVYDGALDKPEQAEKEAFAERLAAYSRDADRLRAEWQCRELGQKLREHCGGGLDEWQASQAKAIKQALSRSANESWQAFYERLPALGKQIAVLAADIHYWRLPGADGGPCPVVMGSTERWFKEPYFFKVIGPGRRRQVEIEAARGEYEGFQVALLAPARHGFEKTRVETEELKGPDGAVIPPSHIEWGWLRDITTDQPHISVPFVGPIPDAIMEGSSAFDVAPGSFTPVYFRVCVDRDTKPGVYEGGVVFVSGERRILVPVTLKVRNFTLPVRGSLKMAFSFFEHFYQRWYKLPAMTEEKQRNIYEFLLKYRVSPNNIYAGGETYPDRRFLDTYRDRINFFTYGSVPSPPKPVPETKLSAWVEKAAEVHEWVKASGRLGDGYVYSYDEISCNPEALSGARPLMTALRKAMPDAKFMQTSFPDPSYDALFNVWCPLFNCFAAADHQAMLSEKRREGHEIWWYAADNPTKPYPNFFLDYPVFDCRIIATLSWLHRVDGVLYWCVNREWATNAPEKERWPEGEWKPHIFSIYSGARKYRNGMGNFVYPGPDGRLLPSLRLENLRDGLEDYEYLCLMRSGIEKLRQQNGAPGLLARAEAVLAVPQSVARAVNDYSSDPSHLLAWRARLADMIEALASMKVSEQ